MESLTVCPTTDVARGDAISQLLDFAATQRRLTVASGAPGMVRVETDVKAVEFAAADAPSLSLKSLVLQLAAIANGGSPPKHRAGVARFSWRDVAIDLTFSLRAGSAWAELRAQP